jgi:hypothetical protein
MSLTLFIELNQALGEVRNKTALLQRNGTDYDLTFDLFELSRHYESPSVSTKPYVDYLAALLNMFAHLCLNSFWKAIFAMRSIGLDESHILCCTTMDHDTFHVHEALK